MLGAVVDAIVSEAAGRLELPAPPPVVRTAGEVAEAFTTRLTAPRSAAPAGPVAQVARRLEQWSRSVTAPAGPDWSCSSSRPTPTAPGSCRCSARAPRAAAADRGGAGRRQDPPRLLADELVRLERMLPVLLRPGAMRRGPGVLSQDEAWELMTVTGAELEAAGFDVRVPALSRRKPSPVLRLFAEPAGESVVGAHQLSNVRWSVVFDDVELTAADIARLATEARRSCRSRGRWVELDRVDLKEAAAALAERARTTTAHRRGDPPPRGSAWRASPLRRASRRRAAAGPPSCSRRRRRAPDARHHPAGGLRRRAPQLPGRGAGLAGLPRRGRAGRLPGARHGPGQDAHGARPHRPHDRRRARRS